MRKESLAELIRKRSNLFALIMCLMGVVINMALNSLVSALDLPLYLDTVGTVLVAALGGYLPGAIVGFFTNVVKALSNPASLYYGLVNIFIAFIYFYKNFMFRYFFCLVYIKNTLYIT